MKLQFFPLGTHGHNLDKILNDKTAFVIRNDEYGRLSISIEPYNIYIDAWATVEIDKNQARYLINYLTAYIADTDMIVTDPNND
jgi:hypothetical protein